MMTCDALRNRLLAEPDPTRAPAELRPHLAGCAACREFVARYESLAANIAALAAPNSELAKLAFVENLTSAGPIIKSVPGVAASAFSWKTALLVSAKPIAATAAAIAVGVGIWAVSGSRRPASEQAGPRHELLKNVVAKHAALARTGDARSRILPLADLATDLRTETRELMLAAPKDDLDSLAAMFESVVNDGLVKQAAKIDLMNTPPSERKALLENAADKLAAAADDANALMQNAPPHAKPALARIANTAARGRTALQKIVAGEGA